MTLAPQTGEPSLRSRDELLAQLRNLEDQYRMIKVRGAMQALAGRGTLDQVEAQLLVVAGSMMLCQWALGHDIVPPVELIHAGWTPPPGMI